MRSFRSSIPAAALSLAAFFALGACGSENERAEPLETTTSSGAPLQGDPQGANSGAGGDAGGPGAVDPMTSQP